MVYADGSNPSVRKDIGVRLPSPAHLFQLVACLLRPEAVAAKRADWVWLGVFSMRSLGFKHLRFCGHRFGTQQAR